MEKKIEGIIFKQTNTEKKNLNIQYDLLTKSENYEIYKEKADNIFFQMKLKNEILLKDKNYIKNQKT